MNRSWLAPLTLITLTAAFLLLWESPPQALLKPEPTSDRARSYPNNIVVNSVNRRFDEDGRLASKFTAEETRYFQINPKRITDKDHTLITKPSMIIYNPEQPPWNVSSNLGKSSKNGTLIELDGDVRLWKKNSLNQISELTTSSMVVKPEQEYAQTNKPVTIRSVNEITQAIGMKAFLKEDRVQLLSKVRGVYEPQP